MKTLTHALVSSRLDYCNSLLHGVNDGLLKKLQTVHNAAAVCYDRNPDVRLLVSSANHNYLNQINMY